MFRNPNGNDLAEVTTPTFIQVPCLWSLSNLGETLGLPLPDTNPTDEALVLMLEDKTEDMLQSW